MKESTKNHSSFKGFVFLNLQNPFVAWETYRGILISASSGAPKNIIPISPMFANLIWSEDSIRTKNEIIIDNFRFENYPSKISRLIGMYFFRDYESAIDATKWGSHFSKENLTEVEIFPDKDNVTKVDANWITYAKRNANNSLLTPYIDSFKKYWAGETYSYNPHWEYIINGRARILNEEIRQKALKVITKYSPNSLLLLEMSYIAAILGYDFGHIVPWIGKSKNNNYKLNYIINFNDKNNINFKEAFNKYRSEKDTTYMDSLDPAISLQIPNLTMQFTEFIFNDIDLPRNLINKEYR